MTRFIQGLLIASLLLLLCPAPATAKRTRLRTAHFDFEFDPSIRSSVMPLIKRANQYREQILADLGALNIGRTRVIFTYNFEDFQRAQPKQAKMLPWMAAVAWSARSLVIIRADSYLLPELNKTFLHEFSHIALIRGVGLRRLPRWFVEGFAVYQADEIDLNKLRTFMDSAVSGTLFPLRDLDRYFPAQHRQVSLAYAQSAAFVSWLIRTGGRDRFQALIQQLLNKQPFEQALQKAYGRPLSQLEKQWHKQLENLSSSYLFTGEIALWAAISVLFLLVWLHVSRRRKRALAAMPGSGVKSEEDIDIVYLDPR